MLDKLKQVEDRYEERDAARLLEDLRPKAPTGRDLAVWARAFCARPQPHDGFDGFICP